MEPKWWNIFGTKLTKYFCDQNDKIFLGFLGNIFVTKLLKYFCDQTDEIFLVYFRDIYLLSRAARRAARLKRNGSKKCAYGVCPNKWQGEGQKVRKKCQNLGHLQTAISQARKKLLTNFQRLESTTMDGHMVCVQKSDIERVKKWGKSAKIRGTFKQQYIKLEKSFWQTFKG